MRIAIIGTGVSGLTAAHLLNPHHDVKVYEAANYIGGHVNTIDVEERKQSLSIDTGFIVFNDWTYPNFENLIDKLDVDIDDSEMSFSARCENTGFEWSGSSLSTLIFLSCPTRVSTAGDKLELGGANTLKRGKTSGAR